MTFFVNMNEKAARAPRSSFHGNEKYMPSGPQKLFLTVPQLFLVSELSHWVSPRSHELGLLNVRTDFRGLGRGVSGFVPS